MVKLKKCRRMFQSKRETGRQPNKDNDDGDVCVFCNLKSEDVERYGQKLKKGSVTVHYYCMLFAAGLGQNGKDNEGILGFFPRDIERETRRAARLRCTHCKEFGATIGCLKRECRVKFHFGCGLDNHALNQYFGNFSSFCAEHRPTQSAPHSGRLSFKGNVYTKCIICMGAVEARASFTTLRAPCCRSNWYHKCCIQGMATCSGKHFFKCPLCNNKDIFQKEMLAFGIYIPDQDAEWELEPNAYSELLERHSHCDVTTCLCPRGRAHNMRSSSKWEIVLCDVCGSQGCHIACGYLHGPGDDWVCKDCTVVVDRLVTSSESPCAGPSDPQRNEARESLVGSLKTNRHKNRTNGKSSGKEHKIAKVLRSPASMTKRRKRSLSRSHRQRKNEYNSPCQSLPRRKRCRLSDENSPFAKGREAVVLNTVSTPLEQTESGENSSEDSARQEARAHRAAQRHSPLDVQPQDLQNMPRNLHLLLNDDIHTGANLGTKWVSVQETLNVFQKEDDKTGDSCQENSPGKMQENTQMPKTRAHRAAYRTEPVVISPDILSVLPRWMKSLMGEDIFTGTNLGSKFSNEWGPVKEILVSDSAKPTEEERPRPGNILGPVVEQMQVVNTRARSNEQLRASKTSESTDTENSNQTIQTDEKGSRQPVQQAAMGRSPTRSKRLRSESFMTGSKLDSTLSRTLSRSAGRCRRLKNYTSRRSHCVGRPAPYCNHVDSAASSSVLPAAACTTDQASGACLQVPLGRGRGSTAASKVETDSKSPLSLRRNPAAWMRVVLQTNRNKGALSVKSLSSKKRPQQVEQESVKTYEEFIADLPDCMEEDWINRINLYQRYLDNLKYPAMHDPNRSVEKPNTVKTTSEHPPMHDPNRSVEKPNTVKTTSEHPPMHDPNRSVEKPNTVKTTSEHPPMHDPNRSVEKPNTVKTTSEHPPMHDPNRSVEKPTTVETTSEHPPMHDPNRSVEKPTTVETTSEHPPMHDPNRSAEKPTTVETTSEHPPMHDPNRSVEKPNTVKTTRTSKKSVSRRAMKRNSMKKIAKNKKRRLPPTCRVSPWVANTQKPASAREHRNKARSPTPEINLFDEWPPAGSDNLEPQPDGSESNTDHSPPLASVDVVNARTPSLPVSVESQMEAVESQNESQMGVVESQKESQMEVVESQMESQMEVVESQMESQMEVVESQMESQMEVVDPKQVEVQHPFPQNSKCDPNIIGDSQEPLPVQKCPADLTVISGSVPPTAKPLEDTIKDNHFQEDSSEEDDIVLVHVYTPHPKCTHCGKIKKPISVNNNTEQCMTKDVGKSKSVPYIDLTLDV